MRGGQSWNEGESDSVLSEEEGVFDRNYELEMEYEWTWSIKDAIEA